MNCFIFVYHIATTTCPSKGTDAQTLDGHYPDATDDILAVVLIRLVYTLTVIDTYLIVEQTASVGIGEEVTGKLDTDITSTRTLFTSTVSEGRELVDYVSIATPTLCNGVGWVLKSKGTLELSCTDFELRESSPFCIEVYQLYCWLARSCGVRSLNLGAPVEVANLAVQNETSQTKFESV